MDSAKDWAVHIHRFNASALAKIFADVSQFLEQDEEFLLKTAQGLKDLGLGENEEYKEEDKEDEEKRGDKRAEDNE